MKKEPVKKEPAKKTEEMKKVKMSGKAPVDSYFSKQSQGVVV